MGPDGHDINRTPLTCLAGVNAESSWEPTRLVVSAWLEHAHFASWLINAVKPKVFVELGTHNGFSFFTMCEAAARLGTDTKSYAVDTWRGDEHAGFYDEAVYTDVLEYSRAKFADDSTLFRGYFDEFVPAFSDGSIDLLHIDGRHGYDDVRHDFEAWLPKVSPTGVILLHDIAERSEGFGVWRFWDEVREKYPSFEFEHGHGLGVLAVGPDISSEIEDLVAADGFEATNIREFYATMGQQTQRVFSAELRNAAFDGEISAIKSSLLDADSLISEMAGSYSWRLTAPLRQLAALFSQTQRSRVRKFLRRSKNLS